MTNAWLILDWKAGRRAGVAVRTQALANAVVQRVHRRTGYPLGVMASSPETGPWPDEQVIAYFYRVGEA